MVREVADAHDTSMAAVALAWVTDQPTVSSTILEVRTVEQLEDNLAAAQLRLRWDDHRRLDEVSAPPTPDYPYGLLTRMADQRRSGTR